MDCKKTYILKDVCPEKLACAACMLAGDLSMKNYNKNMEKLAGCLDSGGAAVIVSECGVCVGKGASMYEGCSDLHRRLIMAKNSDPVFLFLPESEREDGLRSGCAIVVSASVLKGEAVSHMAFPKSVEIFDSDGESRVMDVTKCSASYLCAENAPKFSYIYAEGDTKFSKARFVKIISDLTEAAVPADAAAVLADMNREYLDFGEYLPDNRYFNEGFRRVAPEAALRLFSLGETVYRIIINKGLERIGSRADVRSDGSRYVVAPKDENALRNLIDSEALSFAPKHAAAIA